MMSMTDAVADWMSLVEARSGAKRYFDAGHPLDLLYGGDPDGSPVFIVMTPVMPPELKISRDVSVTRRQRGDGQWVLVLRLEDPRLFATFARLCLDLVQRSRASTTSEQGFDIVMKVLDEWKLLLRSFKPRRLSLNELRGLVAELWYGFRVLAPVHTPERVAQSWTGPLGAPQDFTFLDDRLYEVKAVRQSNMTVRITSAEQLDPLEKSMTLAVVVLDDCDAQSTGAFSIITLLDDIRHNPALPFETRSHLDNLLLQTGLDESDGYYSDTHFAVVSYQEYRVDEAFPSLRASEMTNVPVSHVRYDLALRPLSNNLIREVPINPEGADR